MEETEPVCIVQQWEDPDVFLVVSAFQIIPVSLAFLILAFPVFVFISLMLHRNTAYASKEVVR